MCWGGGQIVLAARPLSCPAKAAKELGPFEVWWGNRVLLSNGFSSFIAVQTCSFDNTEVHCSESVVDTTPRRQRAKDLPRDAASGIKQKTVHPPLAIFFCLRAHSISCKNSA